MADMTCDHNRLAGSCEDCEYDRAVKAGMPVWPEPPRKTRGRNEAAVDDTGSLNAPRRRKG